MIRVFIRSIFGLGLLYLLTGFGLPKNLQRKVDKEVLDHFGVQEYQMKAIAVPGNMDLPSEITGDNLFKLFNGQTVLGYAFVDHAPSKTAEFDYFILLDSNLQIVKSKVLIYREEYGGEIGSKRWLKQFNGKGPDDRVDYRTNIDGIAGATISVRSMTNAVDNLLQTLSILQKNDLL